MLPCCLCCPAAAANCVAQDEEDIEAGDADHQWERHEITKYREWAHSEGFRATGDKYGKLHIGQHSETVLQIGLPGGQTFTTRIVSIVWTTMAKHS